MSRVETERSPPRAGQKAIYSPLQMDGKHEGGGDGNTHPENRFDQAIAVWPAGGIKQSSPLPFEGFEGIFGGEQKGDFGPP